MTTRYCWSYPQHVDGARQLCLPINMRPTKVGRQWSLAKCGNTWRGERPETITRRLRPCSEHSKHRAMACQCWLLLKSSRIRALSTDFLISYESTFTYESVLRNSSFERQSVLFRAQSRKSRNDTGERNVPTKNIRSHRNRVLSGEFAFGRSISTA